MLRAMTPIAIVILAVTLAMGASSETWIVYAQCTNQAAASPIYHEEASGVPAGSCSNCFTSKDSWTSSDYCIVSWGSNCVWVPNSVVVTRQDFECVGTLCSPKGAPYELPQRRGQYVTRACTVTPQ